MDNQTVRQIEEAVQRAFSAGVDENRYVDVSRIPLICQSIVQIGKDISEIKESINTNDADARERIDGLVTQDQFWPVKTLIYGFVGLMLTGIMTAIMLWVIRT